MILLCWTVLVCVVLHTKNYLKSESFMQNKKEKAIFFSFSSFERIFMDARNEIHAWRMNFFYMILVMVKRKRTIFFIFMASSSNKKKTLTIFLKIKWNSFHNTFMIKIHASMYTFYKVLYCVVVIHKTFHFAFNFNYFSHKFASGIFFLPWKIFYRPLQRKSIPYSISIFGKGIYLEFVSLLL